MTERKGEELIGENIFQVGLFSKAKELGISVEELLERRKKLYREIGAEEQIPPTERAVEALREQGKI